MKPSFRQEVVRLHRQIFKNNRNRINSSVAGYTEAFRKYEATYQKHVKSYQSRVGIEVLDKAIDRADVVYVGDYHTLPQAQRTVVRLLRRLPQDRPIVLGVEFVLGRHQKHLEGYLEGRLSEREFLQAIEHGSHWVFGGWENFRPIFDLIRHRKDTALAIDSLGSGSAGESLARRDKYAARRISKSLDANVDALHIVLMGELHIAPPHLPKEVSERTKRRLKNLYIYQNSEEIYWRLAGRGLEHKTELVRIDKDAFCMMNTPPIVAQQSFLNWLQADSDGAPLDAPDENFRSFATLISEFFELPLGDALDHVYVYSVYDIEFLDVMESTQLFNKSELKHLRSQVLRSESVYIPRARSVYLGNLSVNHAAEEATHFLRHHGSGCREPTRLVDAFYARVFEEAIGFLGSKLINHKRKCPHEPYFRTLSRKKSASSFERQLARSVLKHVRMEAGAKVRGLADIYQCDAEMFNALTHVLGYRLGDRMYYGLLYAKLDREEVRAQFFEDLGVPGTALAAYLYFIVKTHDVDLPERF